MKSLARDGRKVSFNVFSQEPGSSPAPTEFQPFRLLRRYRTGAISFFAARPLICGLDSSREIELVRRPPSRLRGMLAGGELDAAIIPASELLSLGPRLTVLPAGCISAVGATLSARIFSQVQPKDISVLWVDSNSRSISMLVRLLWISQFHRRISTIPFDPARDRPARDAEAVLLIGDKVVADPPIGFDWQFDPTAMWYEMTGLPFVFAVWATMRKDELQEMYELLLAAREDGERHLGQIAAELAPAYNWPTDLAIRCLTSNLQYDFGDAQREGLEEFLEMSHEYGLIESPGPVNYYTPM